jgi:hypothetical protein
MKRGLTISLTVVAAALSGIANAQSPNCPSKAFPGQTNRFLQSTPPVRNIAVPAMPSRQAFNPAAISPAALNDTRATINFVNQAMRSASRSLGPNIPQAPIQRMNARPTPGSASHFLRNLHRERIVFKDLLDAHPSTYSHSTRPGVRP